MQGDDAASPLLSLPWLPLMTVIKSIPKEDRQAAASTCKSLAAAVSAASQDTKLTVRSNTGWKRLQQVLDNNTLTCKALEFVGHLDTIDKPANSALCIYSKSDIVLNCTFPGIQRVVLNARRLPCLLPTNLASILPDLKELTLNIGDYEQYAKLRPLPYCSSLTAISFCGPICNMQHLPSNHHTPDDLKKQLPNIACLRVTHRLCSAEATPGIVTMIQAWGGQLTSLELDTYMEPEHLQRCTRLRSLTLGFLRPDLSPSYIPKSMTKLTLHTYIRAGELETILQLPLLQTFECRSITDNRFRKWLHDYSDYPCTWQQLKIHSLKITDLAKLPLHSLKKEGGLSIHRLILPDPLSTSSMPEVSRAVQHVKEAGVTIEGLERWQCDYWKDTSAAPHLDMASAELVLAACSIVKPPSRYVCDWASMLHYQQAVTAVVDWLSHTIRDIECSSRTTFPPWLWQALQRCSALRHVKWQYNSTLFEHEIFGQVLLASEYIVAANLTPFLLEVKCREDTSASIKAMEGAAVCLEEFLPQKLCDVEGVDLEITITIHLVATSRPQRQHGQPVMQYYTV